ncbi:MAG: SusF/SusE family outer membrane protein [Saprospiraceae bacterium]|nr:SusF/SusE family outer membrane protein [Saprospiraceae bacterium]
MKSIKFGFFTKLFTVIAILGIFTFSSCDKDDDPDTDPKVEDGIYVYGDGTALAGLDSKGLMKGTNNEADGNKPRNGMYELYIAVKAGTQGFNIAKVEGGKSTVYGPGTEFKVVADADKDNDEPKLWFSRGVIQATANKFTVPEDGLYHVVYDETLNVAVVARVEWGIIGGATPNGWGGSTALTSSPFNLTAMSFEIKDLILLAGEYKFRYSNGWKLILDGTVVRANTNYGGTLADLKVGAGNIQNTVVGKYTVKVDWALDKGVSASLTKTGDYTPPAYPDAMYIVGEGSPYGWDTPGTKADAIMHKLAGGGPSEGIFWKICHIEGGKGFKLSAANWGNPNLGFPEVTEFDAEGVAVLNESNNMKVNESGQYIVVVNLRDNKTKVSVKPAEVFGIGEAFGGIWDAGVPANKFTVDNATKTIVFPALLSNGAIRMYASHAWIPAWWNAEFRVDAGKIDYRNDGGDQAAVNGTAGQKITLKFDDNTGSIQ